MIIIIVKTLFRYVRRKVEETFNLEFMLQIEVQVLTIEALGGKLWFMKQCPRRRRLH